jgi:predicted Zn-dependent protease
MTDIKRNEPEDETLLDEPVLDETVLERNVAELLSRAHEPPRMEREARARVLATLKTRRAVAKRSRPIAKIAGYSGLAMAAAVLLGVGVWQLTKSAPASEQTAFTNEDPAPREVALEDGTKVVLRQGAEIAVEGSRRVRLVRGEAFFDVARADDEFVVDVPQGRAVVLGTKFLLNASDEETLAAVARGRVRIENGSGEEVLGAGEEGELRENERPTRRPAPRLTHLTSWMATHTASAEETTPVRGGTLIARQPNWQTQEYPLPVRDLTVDVYVENQVARVAIDQTFFNEQQAELEGVYSFPLPSGAAISRLAMYVDGNLMEAGIVERQRARRIYDSIVYERRDPALLEWMEGNRFKVRIFPLRARQEKRILLSYTEAVSRLYDDYRIEVPIPALDAPVDEVTYRVHVVGCAECEVGSTSHPLESSVRGDDRVVEFTARNHRVGRDFAITVRDPSNTPEVVSYGTEDTRYWMTRVRPDLTNVDARREETRRWVVLHDTSASRAPQDLVAQREFAEQLVEQMDEDDEVAVVAFDTTVRRFGSGLVPVKDVSETGLRDFLIAESHDAVGATDLGRAFDEALAILGDESVAAPYVVYLGDGIATASGDDLDSLRRKIEGRATVVSVAFGDSRDETVLEGLARATGGLTASVSAGENIAWRAFDLVATLSTARVLDVRAELLGADGSPIHATTYASSHQLSDGEELTIVSRLGETVPAAVRLTGRAGSTTFTQTIELGAPRRTDARYLPRLWARERVSALVEDGSDEHRDELIQLGRRHFLITPHTSLLVLENDAMYDQFDVPRDRRRDWAHYRTPRRIDVAYEPPSQARDYPVLDAEMIRSPADILQRRPTMLPGFGIATRASRRLGSFGGVITGALVEDSIGIGGLGLIGSGRGGGGTGESNLGLGRSDAAEPATVSVTTAELRESTADRWELNADQERSRAAANAAAAGPMMRAPFQQTLAPSGAPTPLRYSFEHDARLNDLTAFLPGMFDTTFDELRRDLYRSDEGAGSVSDEAASILRRAREQAIGRRYSYTDGSTLSVASDGSFVLRRAGVVPGEEIWFGSNELVHVYSELGLELRRSARDVEAAVYFAYAPFVVPAPEMLARWYEVTVTEGTVVLRRPGAEHPELSLRFDANGRLAAIVAHEDGGEHSLATYAYDGGALVAGDTRVAISVASESSRRRPQATFVTLPLRQPAYWEARLESETPGTAEWREVIRQLLASQAALEDTAALGRTLTKLIEVSGQPAIGELALASHAAGTFTIDATDAVAAYFRAVHSTRPAWDEVATAHPGTLPGMLAEYRALLASIPRADDAFARHERFSARYSNRALRYVAAQQLSNRWYSQRPMEVAAAFDRVASDGELWAEAQYAAVWALYNGGRYDDASERLRDLYLKAVERGIKPPVDYLVAQAFWYGSQGQAGFDMFWAGLREAVQERGTPIAYLTLLDAAAFAQGRSPLIDRDIDRAAAHFVRRPPEDIELRMAVIDALLRFGRIAQAHVLLAPIAARDDASPAVLQRAAAIADSLSRPAEAATYLERTLDALENENVGLAEIRRIYQAAITALDDAATASTDPDPFLDRALKLVAEWRRIDPDNTTIDTLAARTLYTHDRGDEAWRQLSTILERHPMEGESYGAVASVLQQEGNVRRAEELLTRAAEVEPENPTWLLRRAETLFVLDRNAEARALLQRIENRTWHERFAGIEWQAQDLARRNARR